METDEIIKAVSEVCGCSLDEIRSKSREYHLVAARKIITYLCPQCTSRRLGELINRGYTVVLYYRRNLEGDVKYDRRLRGLFDEVLGRMAGGIV
jgi:chromosomal replication initiation ATPase DnaA